MAKRCGIIVALLAVLFMALPATAQRQYKLEDLPANAIDTIDTQHPEAKIIIQTNNTYRYYFPNYEKLIAKPVFMNNWVVNQVFSYANVGLAALPESVELELVKSLSEFHTPTYGRISSRYGPRRGGTHKGIDICVPNGEPIYATFEGLVRHAKYNGGGYGNLVIIRHPNGLETYYGHLCKINVKVNDYVIAGQVIGYGGNTGRSSGPHLHYEVRYYDHAFDPERIIDFSNGELKWQTFVLEKKYFNARSKASDAPEEDDFEKNLVSESGEPLSSEQIVENLGGEMPEEKKEAASSQSLERKSDSKAPVTPSGTTAAAAQEEKNLPVYHTVKGGENLYRIASKYGTSVSAICKLNGMKSTDTLPIGKKLRVK
jgi:murein DD-endopeptidase MepM/ murein hydrolase activator NlpD